MNPEEQGDILLVDDSPDNLVALEAVLADLGQNLVKATSGEEALRLLLRQDFAVILLDVQMADLDGFETARLIRARRRSMHTPIIFITAIDRNEQRVFEGYSTGAVDYLFKPIAPEILRSKVSVFVELFKKSEEIKRQSERLAAANRQLQAEIGQRIRSEQALQEKNVELENANRAKDRFLGSMSHELRTPLNAIIGFTGTLLMQLPGPLTPEQEKQLRTIETNAEHLLALINDLLDLAKIEAGKVEFNLEPVHCQSVVEQVVTTLRPLAEIKGLRFETRIPPQDLVIDSDPRALSQIIINLTNNAIKFTEQGRVCLELDQRRVNDQKVTEIKVVDTGIGIRPEDQLRLFKAFEQIDRSRRHEGAGLGLYLSQKLAGLLGGRIECESRYGQGSQFTLIIPERG